MLAPQEDPVLAKLAELGIEHAVVLTDGPWTDDALDRLAAAVPLVEKL